jgi:hypothetical protein
MVLWGDLTGDSVEKICNYQDFVVLMQLSIPPGKSMHSILNGIFLEDKGAAASNNRVTTLMMEAARSSETSVDFYQTTWYNMTEDSNLHTCCCENLKSHWFIFFTNKDDEETNTSYTLK